MVLLSSCQVMGFGDEGAVAGCHSFRGRLKWLAIARIVMAVAHALPWIEYPAM